MIKVHIEEPNPKQFNEHDQIAGRARAEQIANAQVRLVRLIARCASQLIRTQGVGVLDEKDCAKK